MRTLFGLTALVAIVYAGLCAILFLFQRALIYFPQPRWSGAAPAITLPVEGAQLVVTSRVLTGRRALLYFGGNAEDVSLSLPSLAPLFPDRALYLLHYRGYGGSSGQPSEAALVADAIALFDRVRAEHPDVLVIGRSLGSGVAIQLAAARPVERLVLVTPFDSIVALAAQQFPFVPVHWLLLDKFESSKVAPHIAVPTLVIAAEDDEVIPRARTEALVARFRSGTAILTLIPGTGHNTISDSADYAALLRSLP